jgi:integrase
VAFDGDIQRRKRMGTLAELDAGKQTIAEFAETDWWQLHAELELSPRTRKVYAYIFDVHLAPRVGRVQLRAFTAQDGARLRAELEASRVGPAATRKALMLLQGIFASAVRWNQVRVNPLVAVAKPSGLRKRAVHPASPRVVEAMRADLRARGQLRDASLVVLLAYAGVRPGEALALSWAHVKDRVLLIERALDDDGSFKGTKNGGIRTVDLVSPLAADLAEWRLACGRPDPDALVFPTRDGAAWTAHDWQNWRRRRFQPTAKGAGLVSARPYDLRHTFCSLLIAQDPNIAEVARQAGHSPGMTLSTYAHVIEELRGVERVSAENAIRAARAAHVSEKCPQEATVAVR